MKPGWVWLCGAGPGDPGLLTLHGLNALKQADIVVYDALVDPAILEWAPQAKHVFAGKRAGVASAKQRDISAILVEMAQDGKRVLRLKGGDPYMFGRDGEEAQTLIQKGVNIRIIPGISAGIGGLAYAGIPVTHRDVNQAVTFVTGHGAKGTPPVDWAAISRGSEVIVIYMGMRRARAIAEALIAAGRSTNEPVAVVYGASTKAQFVLATTLEKLADDIAAQTTKAPGLICIGRAVLLRQILDWQALEAGQKPRNLDPLGRGRGADEE
jgi:uroporphyrin-III C-methyltransferase